jgi:hypothetical protein
MSVIARKHCQMSAHRRVRFDLVYAQFSNHAAASYLQRRHPELHQEFRDIVNQSSHDDASAIAGVA